MEDILFKTDDYVFSYRVGGLLIHNGKVLMQKAVDDEGYAFIGGHVAFGETTAETIVREFKEEIDADIKVEKTFTPRCPICIPRRNGSGRLRPSYAEFAWGYRWPFQAYWRSFFWHRSFRNWWRAQL